MSNSFSTREWGEGRLFRDESDWLQIVYNTPSTKRPNESSYVLKRFPYGDCVNVQFADLASLRVLICFIRLHVPSSSAQERLHNDVPVSIRNTSLASARGIISGSVSGCGGADGRMSGVLPMKIDSQRREKARRVYYRGVSRSRRKFRLK